MLTPQDIQNKEFVKAVFGGYDMQGVDDFLEELAEDYAALYKDNAILKSKIKVLVEKVEEYRSTEDAMRMALLTAQKMGDEMLDESKKKSSSMIEAANEEARKKRGELAREISSENERLRIAKQKTKQFILSAKTVTAKYEEFLNSLEAMDLAVEEAPVQEEPAPAPEKTREEKVNDTAKEIDNFVSQMLAKEAKAAPAAAPVPEDEDEPTKLFRIKNQMIEDDDEPTTPRPRFDFDDLKFGTNYRDD